MTSCEANGSLHQGELEEAVRALIQQLHGGAQDMKTMEKLIQKLKQLQAYEHQIYGYTRLNSETRRRLDRLDGLIHHLELQLERARRVVSRKGLKYYLAKISNRILGDEMQRIADSVESELQSWLDQHNLQQLVTLLHNAPEDEQAKAISAFEALVRKGYDPHLQEAILSSGMVDHLVGLLEPDGSSWSVQKEAASALSAVVYFNKDIFVGMMLMVGLVEKLLNMLIYGSEDVSLVAICALTSLIIAGKGAIVDEIQSNGGVKKLVDVLDTESPSLQRAAMDLIFEMTYHGRREVVDTLLEQGLVKKLVRLEHPINHNDLRNFDVEASDTNGDGVRDAVLQNQKNPFANAVARFALQVGLSLGLRQREKKALKQEILRIVKEIMPDDVEVADITAEVLWAP